MINVLLKKLILAQTAFAQFGGSNSGGAGGSNSGGVSGNNSGGLGGSNGIIPSKSLGEILDSIIGFAVGLGLTLATLMIIWGGYQMMLARGNPQEFESGKATITYAVIGIIVLLISRALIALIREIIGA